MVEITVPLVLDIIRTAGILVGIIYYITIMRNNQRSNSLYTLEHRMQNMDRSYYQAWSNVLNMEYENIEEFRVKYTPEIDPETYADWCYVASVHQNLGYLLKHGMVDPDTVFELYPPGSIQRLWRRYEVMMEYTQSRGSNLWEHFKYLRDEAKRRFPELGEEW